MSGRGSWFTACSVLVQVEMWLVANEDVKGVCDSVDIHKGERILMEMSRKFTLEDIRQLAFQSDFYVQVAAPPFSGYPLCTPCATKQLSCSPNAACVLILICEFYLCRASKHMHLGRQGKHMKHVLKPHSPAQPLYCAT